MCHGDVADLVHGSAESRAVGAMERRVKCCRPSARALARKNKTGVRVDRGRTWRQIGRAPRRRALAALRFEEREEISRGIAVGIGSIRQIAQGLGTVYQLTR